MEINLTNDLQFKMVMTDENNKELAKSFIEVMTGLQVETIKFLNPYNIHTYKEDFEALKSREDAQDFSIVYTQVDVRIDVNESQTVIVEMQRYKDNRFKKRLTYYVCEGFANSLKKDERDNYSTLKPSYGIAILNQKPTPVNLAVRPVALYYGDTFEKYVEKDEKEYINIVEFYLNADNEDTQVKMWQNFFKEGKIEQDSPEYLKRAIQRLNDSTEEEKEMSAVVETRLSRADDMVLGIEEAKLAEGIEIGIVKGTNKERERAIHKLFKVGSSETFIVSLGYTLEEIQKAKAKLNNLTQ